MAAIKDLIGSLPLVASDFTVVREGPCDPTLRTDKEEHRLHLALYEERSRGSWTKTGFSCTTCKFFNGAFCQNPKVKAPVNENGCCRYWRGQSCYRP